MSLEFWPMQEGEYALYTEDSDLAKNTRKFGLKQVGTYHRGDLFAKPFAWQFAGPKEKVLALVKKSPRGEPEGGKLPAAKGKPAETGRASGGKPEPSPASTPFFTCRCGRTFVPRSNRQVFCEGCREKMKRQRAAERKKRERGKRKTRSG